MIKTHKNHNNCSIITIEFPVQCPPYQSDKQKLNISRTLSIIYT